jgi:hypothetical protein
MTLWTAIQGEPAAFVGLSRAIMCLRARASSFGIARRFVPVAIIGI